MEVVTMDRQLLRAALEASGAMESAAKKSTKAYCIPVENLAKTFGIGADELRDALRAGVAIDGGDVSLHPSGDSAWFRFTGESDTPQGTTPAAGGGERSQEQVAPFAAKVESDDRDRRSARDWEGSPALRAEFSNLAAYQAFRRAEARGHVRIFSRAKTGSIHGAPMRSVATDR
jgi:hypothetical protein